MKKNKKNVEAEELEKEAVEENAEEVKETPKDQKESKEDDKYTELLDRYQRLMAEFDNYRKRTDKEKTAMYDNGTMKALEKMLPVLDNFERGLQSVSDEDKEKPLYAGMDMIYKQMVKCLTEMGVEPIESVGKPFDLNLHNAIMQVENDEMESGTVFQELQKGYTYKGMILRHAMVSVVQ